VVYGDPGVTKQPWGYKTTLGLHNNPPALPRDDNSLEGALKTPIFLFLHASKVSVFSEDSTYQDTLTSPAFDFAPINLYTYSY
jgi:hypothetical protein